MKQLFWSITWMVNLQELRQLYQWDVPCVPTLQEGCVSPTLHSLRKTAKLCDLRATPEFQPPSDCQGKCKEPVLPMLTVPQRLLYLPIKAWLWVLMIWSREGKSYKSDASLSAGNSSFIMISGCAMPWTLSSAWVIFTNNQKKAFC